MIETHGTSMTSAHYARMGQQECEKIHLASLEILERVGVDVHDEKARDLLVKGGAKADGLRVRIPEYMVAAGPAHRAQAPSPCTTATARWPCAPAATTPITAAARTASTSSIIAPGSAAGRCCRTSAKPRPLMDALPEIDFVMSAFLPEDVDQRIYDRYQMEVMLNNTTKPIVFVTPDFEGCVAAVEMCEIVAGGAEAFQRKPFATCYINVTSGLIANAEALQKCMFLAEKGLPHAVHPA